MYGVRVGDLDPQYLLIIVTTLDVACNDTLRAKGLTCLSIKEFISLSMVRTFTKVLKLIRSFISWNSMMVV